MTAFTHTYRSRCGASIHVTLPPAPGNLPVVKVYDGQPSDDEIKDALKDAFIERACIARARRMYDAIRSIRAQLAPRGPEVGWEADPEMAAKIAWGEIDAVFQLAKEGLSA